MRVCILEWICGGGLHNSDPQQVSPNMIDEGWAMLSCLCRQFSSSGHSVTAIVDIQTVGSEAAEQLSEHAECLRCFRSELASAFSDSNNSKPQEFAAQNRCCSQNVVLERTLSVWQRQARTCDLTIVIAPELDRVLEACVQGLVKSGVRVLNCTGELLQTSCDKWLTAQRLHHHKIPHPRTWLATEFRPEFSQLASLWCTKPRWGAGCEGLRIFGSGQLGNQLSQLQTEPSHIVQNWCEGRMFSCSAVVDFNGRIDWMPLVTQEFARSSMASGCEQLRYCGARLAPPVLQSQRPLDLLNATLKALTSDMRLEAKGWIGVDLVLGDQQTWTVIEVNSRLTTSAVELCRLDLVQLASQMLGGYNESVF